MQQYLETHRTRPTRARQVVSPAILWGRACRRGRACAKHPCGCPAGLPLRPLQTLGANNTKRTLHSQAKKPKFTHISLERSGQSRRPDHIRGTQTVSRHSTPVMRPPECNNARRIRDRALLPGCSVNRPSPPWMPPGLQTYQRSWNLHHCPSSCTQVSSR